MTKSDFPWDSRATASAIASALQIGERQVLSAIELLEAGNTIPFIARYRKEATGGLDEVALRAIEDAVELATALAARKSTVLRTIEEQGLLTADLRRRIESCGDLQTLEAIYLPYKPKRRTRASAARECGLQPLADILLRHSPLDRSRDETLAAFVNPQHEVLDKDAALHGALDIVAEQWSEDLTTRAWIIDRATSQGRVTSRVKRGKKSEASKFELYFDHCEPVAKIPGHRVLAMLRGEAEGVLRLGIEVDDPEVLRGLKARLVPIHPAEFHADLLATVEDCYTRLLLPAMESTVMQRLKEKADQEAIAVFGKNLFDLLMSPPAGPRVTLGIDPGFRTGCKVAVVDETGKFLEETTIYPTPPRMDTASAAVALLALIRKHAIELIAIGNGTASRETEGFVADVIRENGLSLTQVMVSESGASIYSASELAGKEFPELDVTVRGAISIARRLQDPLAELVKADPKSIGVGQYQHDVNQAQLRKCLDRVVESCVNQVGVDLNTASAPLLSYVAGIGPKLAENIVAYRDSHGGFSNRNELIKVPKLGKKAFEQAAGFLRIRGGDQPLDHSAVHPECYPIVSRMAAFLRVDAKSLLGNPTLTKDLRAEDFVDGQFGIPTIQDILVELSKPGRDPRREFRVARFDADVHCLEDLRVGLVLEGVITNVTHFGAFVDLGVHQDGLIHISQLAEGFVRDPSEVVSVGDVVKVKVLDVDVARKRIAVTRRV